MSHLVAFALFAAVCTVVGFLLLGDPEDPCGRDCGCPECMTDRAGA